MDLLKVLISGGNINKAVGLTHQMDDASLIEKMWYMAKRKVGLTQVIVKITLKLSEMSWN